MYIVKCCESCWILLNVIKKIAVLKLNRANIAAFHPNLTNIAAFHPIQGNVAAFQPNQVK